MNVFSSETVETLAIRAQQRLESIHGLKFVYSVQSNDSDSPELKKTKQEYKIIKSNDRRYPHSWRSWKIFSLDENDEWILDQFHVYNGKNVYIYEKNNPDETKKNSVWAHGKIQVLAEPDTIMSRNQFEHFLFMGVTGYGNGIADKFVKALGLEKWEIVEHNLPDKYVFEREIKSPKWKNGYNVRVFFSLNPEPMVTRTEIFDNQSSKRDFTEIEKTDYFNNLCYPSQGKSISYASDNSHHDATYSFQVESVEQLTEDSRITWVPEWPKGTIVIDQINNKNFEVPHSREQLLKLQDDYYNKIDGEKNIKMQFKRFWFVLAFNFVGLFLIGIHFFRKYRKQKNSL